MNFYGGSKGWHGQPRVTHLVPKLGIQHRSSDSMNRKCTFHTIMSYVFASSNKTLYLACGAKVTCSGLPWSSVCIQQAHYRQGQNIWIGRGHFRARLESRIWDKYIFPVFVMPSSVLCAWDMTMAVSQLWLAACFVKLLGNTAMFIFSTYCPRLCFQYNSTVEQLSQRLYGPSKSKIFTLRCCTKEVCRYQGQSND